MTEQTHFGFKSINKEEKEPLVKGVFSSVAKNYDIMNNLMSLGIHHLWKNKMLELLPNAANDLLDVAGGTADIAKRYYFKAKEKGHAPKIIACDINEEMLRVGRDKLINANIISGIDFICGNAEKLPFADMSFNYYTIAFGIRNVTNIELAIKEAYRVLKPGGKFVCLEFSHPTTHLLNKFYDFYSFKMIPILGKIVANNRDAYQYLVESIRKFPAQKEFAGLISGGGFKQVSFHNLSGGITALHYGYRI